MQKWRRRIKYYLLRLLRQQSGVHSTALGLSIGFLPHFYPTFGFGPLLAVGLAYLVRANKIAALLSSTVSSWTWPFLFYLNYKVGALLTNRQLDVDRINVDDGSINDVAKEAGDFGWNFIIGAGINTVIAGILLYFVSLYLYSKYRKGMLAHIKKVDP